MAEDYSISDAMIPRPNMLDPCPTGTHHKKLSSSFETCRCEEHCAWNLCRLTVAPDDCLQETNSEWQWDGVKNAWVARIRQGNI